MSLSKGSDAGSDRRVRIVSWNVLAQSYMKPEYYPASPPEALEARGRRARVVERALGLAADVLCLQEIEPATHEALEARLPGHEARLAMKGAKRPDGVAILVRKELGPVTWREVRYSDGTGHLGLLARLPGLGVATTHLRWHPPHETGPGPLEMQELLAALDPDLPWVVCGDLNFEAGSEVLALAHARGFTDAYAATPEAWTCNANRRTKRIDFLLLGPGLSGRTLPVPAIDVDTPLPSLIEPSDHLPIAVELS